LHLRGLAWFRHKQRSLTRAVLALFCLAWLQLAAVPCVMADGAGATAGEPESSGMSTPHDCAYCPPAPPADHCQPDQPPHACTYPGDAQVDSRVTPALAVALPALAPAFTLPTLSVADRAPPAFAAPSHDGPPLPVSYCRFLK
jgi:hypothetical protein